MGILNGSSFFYLNTCKSTVCQCEVHVHAFNSLNADLNPICHLLALLGAHHILHVSRIRVKVCRGIATLILKLGSRWR